MSASGWRWSEASRECVDMLYLDHTMDVAWNGYSVSPLLNFAETIQIGLRCGHHTCTFRTSTRLWVYFFLLVNVNNYHHCSLIIWRWHRFTLWISIVFLRRGDCSFRDRWRYTSMFTHSWKINCFRCTFCIGLYCCCGDCTFVGSNPTYMVMDSDFF